VRESFPHTIDLCKQVAPLPLLAAARRDIVIHALP